EGDERDREHARKRAQRERVPQGRMEASKGATDQPHERGDEGRLQDHARGEFDDLVLAHERLRFCSAALMSATMRRRSSALRPRPSTSAITSPSAEPRKAVSTSRATSPFKVSSRGCAAL